MAWTPPAGVTPVDRRPPAARFYDDIPAILDWLRSYYPSHTVLGLLITALDTDVTYRVVSEPPYGTPGTFNNYRISPVGGGAGGGDAYALSRYASPAELVNAVPPGETAVFDMAGFLDVSASVLVDGTKNASGRGIHGILRGTAALGLNPVLLIRPPEDGNVYDMVRLTQLMVQAHSSVDAQAGGDAIRIDVSGNRKMARMVFDQVFARANNPNGYALHVMNEATPVMDADGVTPQKNPDGSIKSNTIDGFFCPTFLGGAYDGGVKLVGMGDSPTFISVTITGRNGLEVWQQTQPTAWTEASQMLVTGCNLTGGKGNIVYTGTRCRFHGNNIELKLRANAQNYAGAAIQLRGTEKTRFDAQYGVTWDERIKGASIRDNYIGVEVARECVHLGYTDLAIVEGNTLDVGAGNTFAIDVSPNARNSIIGSNVIHCSAGYEVNDQGQGTMGVWQVYGRQVTGRVTRYLAPGRTPKANFEFQSIKRPDGSGGQVTLAGAITGGTTAAGDILAVLPEGQRPPTGRYPMIDCTAISTDADGSGATRQPTFVIANPTGELVLGESLSKSVLQEIRFAGQAFFAPNI